MGSVDHDRERGKLARMARRLNAGAPSCPVGGLILMTDDGIDADWAENAAALPRGSAVIVRHRNAQARERLVRLLIGCCRARGVRVLVADDAGLALRARADGVHLPERKVMLAAGVRRRRRDWIISTSVHGEASVARALRLPVDVLLASPFMPTRSHPGAAALGAVRLASLVPGRSMPVYALGGIDAANAGRLAPTRVRGIAVIRGWCGA